MSFFPGMGVMIFGGQRQVSPTPTVITKTSGTSWTVPNDWNSDGSSIECYGGGGGGGYYFRTTNDPGSGGGGGGGYAKKSNFSLTPGATLYYSVGAGGDGDASNPPNGVTGGTTWVNPSGYSEPTVGSGGIKATGGWGGDSNIWGDYNPHGGPGGQGYYGDINRTGGAGGDGGYGGGGGGGCAGSSSNGGDGGDAPGYSGGSSGGGYAGEGGEGWTTGADGSLYGGAGGGNAAAYSVGAGDGRQGIIIITYYAYI